MSNFLGSTSSALDLVLEGAIGSFKVGKLDNTARSLEVRYMLTHVSLDPFAVEDQKLLERLAPVREVFDLKLLDFDEIMQRDIDDARVSLELIPYLLDEDNRGLIKLYPPIVAVVLPLEPLSRKPAKMYPASTCTSDSTNLPTGLERTLLTCGPVGQEVFQFEQIRSGQKLFKADGAKLRISTQNTALAIVDGQHRAMALLALYRNLKGGWNEAQRQAYKHYYEVWPESLIRKFDTKGIQLPVMLCTFPDLDMGFQGDFDVIRAARRIFLTLNKNARKVSDSRNKLLDDQDMASECLRQTLALIKDANTRSQTPLRIFNVELDQEGDRQPVFNPFAITGVSHLYYICERILFMSDRVSGLTPKGRMGSRRHPANAFHRLHLNNILSHDERDSTRRDNYTDKVARAIEKGWRNTFGPLIVRLLGEVHPLKVHENASLLKNAELEQAVSEGALRAILFDGQGTARVLERFEIQLKDNIRDDAANWATPEIEATKKTIENLNHKRKQIEENLCQVRASLYFENFKGKLKTKLLAEKLVVKNFEKFATSIVAHVFGTVAFQTALVYTLVDMAEACSEKLSDEVIDEYIQGINHFFAPTTDAALRNLVGVMAGSLVESGDQLDIAQTNTTFREVVYPGGEMQPDEWPKYRYLILETWKSKNPTFAQKISDEITKLRAEILDKAVDSEVKRYLEESGKLISAISDIERAECGNKAETRCKTFFAFF